MWGLAAAFYLVAIFHRMSLGVASIDASAALRRLDRDDRAALDGAARRLPRDADPGGLLADRLGPRRSLTLGLLAMGAGELLFAFSPTIGPAIAGRALVGAGDACMFLNVLRVAAPVAPAAPLRARRRADRGVRRLRPVAEHRAAERRAERARLDADVRRVRRPHRGPRDPRGQPPAGPPGRRRRAVTHPPIAPRAQARLARTRDAPRPVGALRAQRAVRDADRAVGVPVPGRRPGRRSRARRRRCSRRAVLTFGLSAPALGALAGRFPQRAARWRARSRSPRRSASPCCSAGRAATRRSP